MTSAKQNKQKLHFWKLVEWGYKWVANRYLWKPGIYYCWIVFDIDSFAVSDFICGKLINVVNIGLFYECPASLVLTR